MQREFDLTVAVTSLGVSVGGMASAPPLVRTTLIKSLGGPAKVAELLGYDKDGGVQRVHNWSKRGIPPRVKVERPDLFLRPPGGSQLGAPALPEPAKV